MVRRWYLIRHGQTDYNAQSRFYGSRDVMLNETGILQAKQVSYLMSDQPVDQVFTSSLCRSQLSAQIIFPHHSYQVLLGLNERDFGLWEGLTADEIANQYPSEWSAWLEAPLEVTPSQAEPFADFRERVYQTVAELLMVNKSLALVAHLGVLRLIYQYLINQKAVFWDIDVPQGQVLVLEENRKGWQVKELRRSDEDENR